MEDGALLGGLALEEGRWLGVPRLRLMGAGALCPDHLDAVVLPGREADVLAALSAWLRRPGSRLLDLDGVAAGARVGAVLPGPVRREVAVAYWTPLPKDPDAWLRARSRNLRANLRKARGRLGRGAVAYRAVRGAAVDTALASSGACTPSAGAADHGSSPATSGLRRRRGLGEADLLRGDERYKRRLAPATRELVRLRAAHGAAGRLALFTLTLATTSRRLAGRALRRALRRARSWLPRRRPIGSTPAEAETAAQGVGAHHSGLGPVDQR